MYNTHNRFPVPGKHRGGLSQETLKLIACMSMLVDHIGVVAVPDVSLRLIGRIAFPLYCFLLVEGFHHTHSVYHYMDRVLLAGLISEIPFDMALYGRITVQHQNVMVTLLLGLLALALMEQLEEPLGKLLGALPVILAGNWLFHSDYGSWGVLLIVLLGIAREMPEGKLLQMAVILGVCAAMPGARIRIAGYRVPMELFGGFSVLPIAFYSGKKTTGSKRVQRAFYFFYPVHLLLLWALRIVL